MKRRDLPGPPGDLSEASAVLWPGFARDLVTLHGGADADFLLLADTLRARDRLAAIQAALAEQGLTVAGSKGQIRPHPLLAAESVARKEMNDGFDRLGLSPARRDGRGVRAGRIQEDYVR